MSDNKKQLILEAYRRSEARLSAQQQLAIAADQRAVTFAGIIFAAAMVLTGIVANSDDAGSLIFTVILLLVSAFCSAWSALPADFGVVGGRYDDMEEDIHSDSNSLKVLEEIGAHNDEHIRDNDIIMNGNGTMMKTSFFFAVIAPLPALLVEFFGI
ncbi:hypothetical protein [Cognatishimia sp.]|uniref:hypothetical protein n=1 Tax=Cognatishimia sp. TaxID=2211648 RepID=UPI003510F291|nr:hypothetical protein [Cognatishimia sp.]